MKAPEFQPPARRVCGMRRERRNDNEVITVDVCPRGGSLFTTPRINE
jgi:hypothetical protein